MAAADSVVVPVILEWISRLAFRRSSTLIMKQSMGWRALADFVVGIHVGFVLFVIFGGLLVLKWPKTAWLHLPAVAWGVWVELAGWICPLTPLENYLRAQDGGGVYSESFVERYLLPVLYPDALTRELQLALAAAVLAINAAVYGRLIVMRRRGSVRNTPSGSGRHTSSDGI